MGERKPRRSPCGRSHGRMLPDPGRCVPCVDPGPGARCSTKHRPGAEAAASGRHRVSGKPPCRPPRSSPATPRPATVPTLQSRPRLFGVPPRKDAPEGVVGGKAVGLESGNVVGQACFRCLKGLISVPRSTLRSTAINRMLPGSGIRPGTSGDRRPGPTGQSGIWVETKTEGPGQDEALPSYPGRSRSQLGWIRRRKLTATAGDHTDWGIAAKRKQAPWNRVGLPNALLKQNAFAMEGTLCVTFVDVDPPPPSASPRAEDPFTRVRSWSPPSDAVSGTRSPPSSIPRLGG